MTRESSPAGADCCRFPGRVTAAECEVHPASGEPSSVPRSTNRCGLLPRSSVSTSKSSCGGVGGLSRTRRQRPEAFDVRLNRISPRVEQQPDVVKHVVHCSGSFESK